MQAENAQLRIQNAALKQALRSVQARPALRTRSSRGIVYTIASVLSSRQYTPAISESAPPATNPPPAATMSTPELVPAPDFPQGLIPESASGLLDEIRGLLSERGEAPVARHVHMPSCTHTHMAPAAGSGAAHSHGFQQQCA